MKQSSDFLHIGSRVVGRRADLIRDDGVTILVGPRWSGTRLVAMRWMTRQPSSRGGLDLGAGAADPRVSWAIVDLTSVTPADDQLSQCLARFESGDLRSLVILGRSLSQIHFDSLRMGTIPRVVGPRQLQLTDADIGELIRERGRSLDDDRLKVLQRATGGWLRLVISAADIVQDRPTLAMDEVALAIRRRVRWSTAMLDEATQTLLCGSPFWDTEMVQSAGLRDNADDAAALLGRAEHAGLLWSQVVDGGTHYVLEPVALALTESEPALVGAHHRRLVTALCEGGRLSDATSVALARDDPAAVWTAAQAAIHAARWDLLVHVAARVSAYPPSWFEQEHPDFRILVTLAGLGRALPFAAWNEVLRSARVQSTPTPEDSLRSCLALIGLYQATGDIQRAMEQARTAVWLSGRTGTAGGLGVQVMALRSATEAFTVGGRIEAAGDAAAKAVSAARQLGDSQAIAAVQVTAELSRLLGGDLRGADAAQEFELAAHVPNVVGSSFLARSWVEYERGDLVSARRLIAQARRILDETDLWWLAGLSDAVVTAHAGEAAAAELIRQEVHRRVEHGWVVSGPTIFASIDLAVELLLGRPAEVLSRFEGRKLEFPPTLVMKAAAHLALRQDDRALRLAQPLTGDPTLRVATLSRLVAAAAAAHQGRPDVAHRYAQLAFQLIETVGLGTAVRYLTAPSQQLVRAELDASQQLVFDQWCRLHGCIEGAREPSVPLSPRERELIVALGSDRSLRQIAEDLGVAHNTVKTLTRRTYRKLGVTSRQDAVDLAQRRRLV